MSLPVSTDARRGASIISTIVATCLLLAATGIIVMGLASLNARNGGQLAQEVQTEVELYASEAE